MITVKRMTISFRCPLSHVDEWLEINHMIFDQGHRVEVVKVNDNGEDRATMEMWGSPESIVLVSHRSGTLEMDEILTKFQ